MFCGYCQKTVLCNPKVRSNDPMYDYHTKYWKVMSDKSILPFCNAECSLQYEIKGNTI